GVAMVMMPVTTAALNQLPSHLIPHGTALNNTMRQIAASVGTAALVTIMASAARDPQTYGVSGLVHGANVAFFVAACVGILGILGAVISRNSHGLEPGQKQSTGHCPRRRPVSLKAQACPVPAFPSVAGTR